MAFKPSDAVEPLEYDFTDSGVDWSGTIPEPSQGDLEQLFADLREIGAQSGLESLASVQPGVEGASPRDALADVTEDTLGTITSALVAAIAKLCKGSPSEEQINALPVRHRQAFIDHLLNELTNPTKRTSASRLAAVRSNGAALAG